MFQVETPIINMLVYSIYAGMIVAAGFIITLLIKGKRK